MQVIARVTCVMHGACVTC